MPQMKSGKRPPPVFIAASAASANPQVFPTCQIGDFLLWVSQGFVTPSTVAGWTDGGGGGANGVFYRIGYQIATTTSNSVSVPNGVNQMGLVYRNAKSVGAVSFNSSASGQVIGFPALTLQKQGGALVVRWAFINSSGDINTGTIPGYANRFTGSTSQTGKDSIVPVGNPGAVNQTTNAATAAWEALSIEIAGF